MRVLIADDHRLIVEGVKRALDDAPDFEVVGECNSGSQVLPMVGRTNPDLVLLDPPRAGAAEAVARIAELKPQHISYVSCDPTTLARDLRKLLDSGFELERVTAIDLFPQTYHIETVALLKKQ